MKLLPRIITNTFHSQKYLKESRKTTSNLLIGEAHDIRVKDKPIRQLKKKSQG